MKVTFILSTLTWLGLAMAAVGTSPDLEARQGGKICIGRGDSCVSLPFLHKVSRTRTFYMLTCWVNLAQRNTSMLPRPQMYWWKWQQAVCKCLRSCRYSAQDQVQRDTDATNAFSDNCVLIEYIWRDSAVVGSSL